MGDIALSGGGSFYGVAHSTSYSLSPNIVPSAESSFNEQDINDTTIVEGTQEADRLFEEAREKLNFEYITSEEEKIAKERARDAKFARLTKIVVTLILLCAFIEVALWKFILPSVASPLVSVTGQETFTARQIVALLRPLNVTNWFAFNIDKAVALICNNSAIENVAIKKVFPNKILISVTERKAVASIFVNIANTSTLMEVDKNGVLFKKPQPKEGVDFTNDNIPVISGLPIDHLTEGMRIGQKFRPLIEQIATIQDSPTRYFSAISEICVVPKEYGNYELVIIPAKSNIKICGDRVLTEDSLKYMMVALDIVMKLEPTAKQIDIRSGVVSYIK